MTKSDSLVLLTNDDGYGAAGLEALDAELRQVFDTVIVAPYEEKSAVSHGVTIHHPLRLVKMDRKRNRYALTGTPADCVIFAVSKLLRRRPDLVVSGINNGPNLGDDIHYSGTVAGAREASFHSIPALAVSLVAFEEGGDFAQAAKELRRIVEELSPQKISPGCFWNVNIPEGKVRGYKFTRQGSRLSWGRIDEKKDARGGKYYWIGRDDAERIPDADTDYQAVRDHLISITPLQHDHTDYRTLRQIIEEREKS